MSARGERGSTLVELLVAVAPALAAVAMLATFARIESRLLAAAAQEVALRDGLRRGAAAMTAEIRVAAGAEPLAVAEPARLGLSTVDASGAPGPPVVFFLDARTGDLAERLGGQTTPVTEGLVFGPDGLRFRYLDACGHELAPGAAGLDLEERARVRTVAIRLAASRRGVAHAVETAATLRARRELACEASP